MYLQRNNQAGLRWNKVWLVLPLVAAPFFALAADVEVSEVAWMGTVNSAQDEWIELRNTTGNAINLEGWTLAAADGQPLITLSKSIGASGFFLLERTNDDTITGIAADLIYTGALENGGEILELKNAAGTVVDRIDAGAGWPAGSNSTKETMQRNSAGVWITAAATPKAAAPENVLPPPPEPPPPLTPPPVVNPPPPVSPPPPTGPPPPAVAAPPPAYSTKPPPPPATSPPPNLDVGRPNSQSAPPPAVVVHAASASPPPVPKPPLPVEVELRSTRQSASPPAKVSQKRKANPPPAILQAETESTATAPKVKGNEPENQEALLAKFFSKNLIVWGLGILALGIAASMFAISLRRENEKPGDQKPPSV